MLSCVDCERCVESVKERECGAWLCNACCASYAILWAERQCADCDRVYCLAESEHAHIGDRNQCGECTLSRVLHCQECLHPIALDRLEARKEWTDLIVGTEFVNHLCPQCEAMCAGVDMASYRPIAYSQMSYAE
jgi:hypothetical protein